MRRVADPTLSAAPTRERKTRLDALALAEPLPRLVAAWAAVAVGIALIDRPTR